jgi:DNA-binding transcriptional ArsR family regulator
VVTFSDDATDRLLSALGNRLRRRILRSLIEAQSPMSPKELAASHRVTINVMSHHIQRLVAVDGVTLVDERPAARGATQHFYTPGPVCGRPLVRDAIGLEGRSVGAARG